MRSCLIIALSMMLSVSAQATIYQTKSSDGSTVFSDTPLGAKSSAVQLKPLSVSNNANKPASLSPGLLDLKTDATQTSKAVTVQIRHPQNGETLWNQPKIKVESDVAPALPEGAAIWLLVDGRRYASNESGQFVIENMDRGIHALRLEVISKAGKTQARSSAVKIYVHRTFIPKAKVVLPQGAR